MLREVSGIPELHVQLHDSFVVRIGVAEIKPGGRANGEMATRPEEQLGRMLDGRGLCEITQGDILFVLANTRHQTIIAKRSELSAIVIKLK
jgi:quercetin dioxygenase-like cupin family protein